MKQKYQNLLTRRSIPNRAIKESFRYNSLLESEDLRYLLGAMDPLDEKYTEICLDEANRIAKYLQQNADTRYQGSIPTNTHIRYHSDIDIVTLSRVFSYSETPVPPFLPNTFDPIAALRTQRATARNTIHSNFPAVSIDETKARALTLTGGSLKRKIDVVIANWYHTDAAKKHNTEVLNAIQILDNIQNTRILNKPFFHQALINYKGNETNDGAKRAMRLLKTLKIDAETKIDISSYDICSIVYNIGSNLLPGGEGASLLNAKNVEEYLWKISENDGAIAKTLTVPNGTRKIIDSAEGTSVAAIKALWLELYRLLKAVQEAGKTVDRQYIFANNAMQVAT